MQELPVPGCSNAQRNVFLLAFEDIAAREVDHATCTRTATLSAEPKSHNRVTRDIAGQTEPLNICNPRTITTPCPSAAKLPLFPAQAARLIVLALIACALADLTWEIWARAITPFLVGGPLEPAALVQSVLGLQTRAPAEQIRLTAGVCSIRGATGPPHLDQDRNAILRLLA